MQKLLVAVLILTVVLSSCLRKDDFSEIPIIEFKEMYQIDQSLVIKLSFTDGNGDIGLRDDEDYYPFGPCDEFYKNLIIDP